MKIPEWTPAQRKALTSELDRKMPEILADKEMMEVAHLAVSLAGIEPESTEEENKLVKLMVIMSTAWDLGEKK